MTSKDWATLWKRAAKRQYHKTDRFLIAWMRTILLAGQKYLWALAWKAAAKKYKAELAYQRYRADLYQQSSKTWEAVVKKHEPELAEQRGQYDALLAEHRALQELLEINDKH